jgi:hypothetical protein
LFPASSAGNTFVYKGRCGDLNGRFCSMRCQDWYDTGNQPIVSSNFFDVQLPDRRAVVGPPGTAIGVSYYGERLDRRPANSDQGGHVKMRQSSDGFMIPCANCRREFDSIGSVD